jgi:hypothetical protein
VVVRLTYTHTAHCTATGWPTVLTPKHASFMVDLTSANFAQAPSIHYNAAAAPAPVSVHHHTVISFEMMVPSSCKKRYSLQVSLPGNPSSTISLHRNLCATQIHATPIA